MKITFALLSLVLAVSACSKTETPTAATSSTSTASSNLPKECQDYIDKMSACVGKMSGPAGDAMKANLDQTKAMWTGAGSSNKAEMTESCKSMNDATAAMKC